MANKDVEQETNFLAVLTEHNPVLALTVDKDREALIAHIEKEVEEKTFDLSTSTGREECRSFAAKITRTKTTLDKTATALTEEWRLKTKAVNDARRPLVDRLDALAKLARQPLTDWEQAEEKRVAECEQALIDLNSMSVVPLGATSAQVEQAIAAAEATEIDPARFQGMTEAAIKARNNTVEVLKAALARIKQQEENDAELARLRAEAEERRKADEEREAQERAERQEQEQRERESRQAEEARKREAEEAERREQERVAAEEEAARQREEAERRAAARAREEAEKEAAAAAAEKERLRLEEVERYAREAQEARDAQAAAEKREREAREEQERKEREERALREAAERDEARRTLCKREAKLAIMTAGVDEKTAQSIVIMVLAGEIPRVSLDFSAEPRTPSARQAFDAAREDAPEAAAEDQPALTA
jgi:colicin import membrane protein